MRIGYVERVALLDHIPALFAERIACVVGNCFVVQLVTLFPKNIVKEDIAHVIDAFFIYYAQMRSNHCDGTIKGYAFRAVCRFFSFCSFSSIRFTRRKIVSSCSIVPVSISS